MKYQSARVVEPIHGDVRYRLLVPDTLYAWQAAE